MKRALITGHEGFVGKNMTRLLEDRGWEIHGFDLVHGDDVRHVFDRTRTSSDWPRYDLVVHCAAVVGGRLTISNDPLAVAIDLEIDAAMFRWAVRTQQPRVVYFSSSAAYPVHMQERAGFRLSEDMLDVCSRWIGAPDMTYGWSKITGELLASYAEAHGVSTYVFRPFSGYSENQALDYPFPTYIDRAKRGCDPFEVWGGNQARDFVHIDDVVETVMAAVEAEETGPLNIGTGRATTFKELAAMCMDTAGYQGELDCRNDMPIGPMWRVADVTRLNALRPPQISLEEGIKRALA